MFLSVLACFLRVFSFTPPSKDVPLRWIGDYIFLLKVSVLLCPSTGVSQVASGINFSSKKLKILKLANSVQLISGNLFNLPT